VDKKLIPKTECLKDTVARVVPCWQNTIVPEIKVLQYYAVHDEKFTYFTEQEAKLSL